MNMSLGTDVAPFPTSRINDIPEPVGPPVIWAVKHLYDLGSGKPECAVHAFATEEEARGYIEDNWPEAIAWDDSLDPDEPVLVWAEYDEEEYGRFRHRAVALIELERLVVGAVER